MINFFQLVFQTMIYVTLNLLELQYDRVSIKLSQFEKTGSKKTFFKPRGILKTELMQETENQSNFEPFGKLTWIFESVTCHPLSN